MADEIVKVIKVDVSQAVTSLNNIQSETIETEQSFKSLGEIRKYIDKMRASLYDLDKDSEDYNRTLKEITKTQEKLKQISKDVVRDNKNIEGSYNALQEKLNELRKVWKSTADETERNSIGKQMLDINTQLKEMDATIGNYQRNVGNYSSAFTQGFRDLAEGIDLIIPGARNLGEVLDKTFKGFTGGKALLELFSSLKSSLLGLTTVSKARAGSEAVVTGELAAQSTLQGTQKGQQVDINKEKVKSVALSNSEIQALKAQLSQLTMKYAVTGDIVDMLRAEEAQHEYNIALEKQERLAQEQVAAATKSTQVAAVGLGATLKGILASIGIGAIIALVGTLVAKLTDYIKKQKEAKEEQERLNIEMRNMSAAAADNITSLLILSNKYKSYSKEARKSDEVQKEMVSSLNSLGIVANDVIDVETVLIKNTSKYIQAMKYRAEADAYRAKASEIASKKLELAAEKESLHNKDYGGGEGGNQWIKDRQRIVEISAELAKLDTQLNKYISNVVNAEKNAAGLLTVPSTGTTTTTTTTTTSSGSKVVDNTATELAEIEKLRQVAEDKLKDDKQRELDILQRSYDEQVAKFQKHNQDIIVLTEAYNKERATIIKKYDDLLAAEEAKKVEAEKQRIAEQLQATTDSILSQIDANNELADFEKELLDISLKGEREKNNELYTIELERLNANIQYYDALASLYAEDSEEYKKYSGLKIQEENKLTIAEAKYKTQRKKDIVDEIQDYASAAESIGSLMSDIGSFWEEDIRLREEEGKISHEQAVAEFEEQKKLQMSSVILTGLAGIASAISSPVANAMGPAGWVAAAAQALTIGVTTALNVAKIKRTQYGESEGGSSSPTQAAVAYVPKYNANYTGQSETQNLSNALTDSQKELRVYVVESDITNAQNKTKVNVKESTF